MPRIWSTTSRHPPHLAHATLTFLVRMVRLKPAFRPVATCLTRDLLKSIGRTEGKGIGMQDSLKVTRFLLLSIGALIVVVLCVPLVIGYGTAQMNTLGAVPGYFVTCLPGWSVISWYEHDELFIPVDDVRRYLVQGCPGVEPRKIPAPGEYISNSVFLLIQRSLDRWYFIGYRGGEDNAIETILPAWNWTFTNHAWVRETFVAVLGFLAVGFFAGLGYVFERVLWRLSSPDK